MERPTGDRTERAARASLLAILACLGNAVLFEALTVLETQDKSVRAVSPWQDDPYDAMVSFAQFTVPVICMVVAMRLTVWRRPGGVDRAQQTLRAMATATGIVAVTLAFEWSAIGLRAQRHVWDGRTGWLAASLVASTIATVWGAVLLARAGAVRRSGRLWRQDWLGDAVLFCSALPLLRRWVTTRLAERVRRHAVIVFATVSLFGAVLVVGALAVGERWTDPLLIGWAVAVETSSNFTFCVISNAIAGFVARPSGGPRRRAMESAVVAGCLAVQLAVAFRTVLWQGLGGSDLSSAAELIALTLGAGLLVGLLSLAVAMPASRLSRRPGYFR